ncbi:MAG: hypothetical protein ABII00_01805, partial [Elusimicrobiota bacterium]
MNEAEFKAVLRELVDENPFAVRAALQILALGFTGEVPTLAVTCEDRPRLLVNLSFVREHCRTQAHVKALICHEFLHVLLRHTERRGPIAEAEHLAFDAVINAVIHREQGPEYSSLMSRYYAEEKGLMRLLRPITKGELAASLRIARRIPVWFGPWMGLYEGLIVADDIVELAAGLKGRDLATIDVGRLLGDHSDRPVRGALAEAL